jgi:hypothetical protein
MPETISVGLYLLLLGVALPMLGFAGNWQTRLRLITVIAAAAQITALVATADSLANWGLFGLISLVCSGWQAAIRRSSCRRSAW